MPEETVGANSLSSSVQINQHGHFKVKKIQKYKIYFCSVTLKGYNDWMKY